MGKIHRYQTTIQWTGNLGTGTAGYQSYARSHSLQSNDKPLIALSSDPAFLGDPLKYNPEELLLASLSSCHMLWYLHLCADNGIVVLEYSDKAEGTMEEGEEGGRFTGVTLKPVVRLASGEKIELAVSLHKQANKKCFIANSCNFEVNHEPRIEY
ncbi:MAG: uncharacterized protein JWQ27_3271 [Ferruginibacter sp.]|nr:uncharacterized protein [Ferruginibacter sp.]